MWCENRTSGKMKELSIITTLAFFTFIFSAWYVGGAWGTAHNPPYGDIRWVCGPKTPGQPAKNGGQIG